MHHNYYFLESKEIAGEDDTVKEQDQRWNWAVLSLGQWLEILQNRKLYELVVEIS